MKKTSYYTPPGLVSNDEKLYLEGDSSPNSLERLLHQYQKGQVRWFNSGTPWLTEGAKSWLARNISCNDKVLEFGAGRSTIFFARQSARVTTVEGSPDWTFWTLFYLYQHPYLLKKVRMHFCPAEWNPSFPEGIRRYWKENRRALDSNDVYELERDISSVSFPGNNIVFFDGNLRSTVFLQQIKKMDFNEVEVIIIDNTESIWNSEVCAKLIPDTYKRLDYVAGSMDVIPPWQNSKHITSIWIREDRLKNSTPVITDVDPHMSLEERKKYMLAIPEEFDVDKSIIDGYAYIKDKLDIA